MDAPALAIAFATVVMPGIGATLAAYRPGEIGIATQLAAVFGGGYATVGLFSTVLALLHILEPATFVVGVVLITVALWYVGLRKGSPRERIRALGADLRGNPWSLGMGVAFVVAFAVVLSDFSPLVNFGKSNPFRYWADGVEIASLGRIPEASLQWGASYPPAISKIVFNAFDAGVSFVIDGPLRAMGALTVACLIALPVSIWAVGTELGFRYGAPLLAVLLQAESGLLRDWMAFPPAVFAGENFGLMVAMTALALAIHALRRTGWKAAIFPGVVFGAAAGVHLVPTLVMLTLFAWYGLSRLAVDRNRRAILGTTVMIFALCGAIAGSSFVLSKGDVGWGGTEGSDRYETHGGRFDPTKFLANGVVEQRPSVQPAKRATDNGGWYTRPRGVLRSLVEKSTRLMGTQLSPRGPALYLVPIGMAVLAVAIVLRFPEGLRPVGLAALGLWMALLGAGLLFSFVYETYLPAMFPQRRLFSYGSLVVVLVAMALLEAVLLLLGRIRPSLPGVAAAALVAIGAATMVFPVDIVPAQNIANGRMTISALDEVRETVPCGERLLVSQRTGGVFQLLTGRAAVTEGLSPFLRPDVSRRVVALLLDARRFFQDPTRHSDFLVEQGIDYVVVARKGFLFDPHPALMGRVDPRRMSDVRFLKAVDKSALVDVYRVDGVSSDASFPDAADFPAYECSRKPLELS